MEYAYKIFPLGDSAITIDFGNIISQEINNQVIARFHQLKNAAIEYVIDIVPAYSSLTIYYDTISALKKSKKGQNAFTTIKSIVEESFKQEISTAVDEQMLVHIPVCYDEKFAPDLLSICEQKKMEPAEFIKIHTSTTYKIYMLGFLPGFAYMGEVDERIAVPRKNLPINMTSGSVGIAGRQTGVYPIESPGGWQIIGRTPWKLFDPSKQEPVLLNAGERVQFYQISKSEFYEMQDAKDYR